MRALSKLLKLTPVRAVRGLCTFETNNDITHRQQNAGTGFTLLQRHATSPVFNRLEPLLTHSSPFGPDLARICGVAAVPTASSLTHLVRKTVLQASTIELRLDWLHSDQERQKFLRWLTRTRFPGITFIATCRRRIGGGEFAGDAGAELHWLIEAAAAGCEWCDLEVETLRELPRQSIKGYAVPKKILLSIHDFRKTPPLPKLAKVARPGEVDAIKVAAMSRSIADSVRLLKLARSSQALM